MESCPGGCRYRDNDDKDQVVLEYPEAVRACAMRLYPWNLGTFLILVFFHSSGCRPYFIFLSFYSVVYSI